VIVIARKNKDDINLSQGIFSPILVQNRYLNSL
jgi:hypothetical protein